MQPAIYKRLGEFLDRNNQVKKGSTLSKVHTLFEALDWGNRVAFSIKNETTDRLTLRVEDRPVVSVVAAAPRNIPKLYSELNTAYNRDIPWVVATDLRDLGLFGSYWISKPDDISSAVAWQVPFDELLLEAPKLALLAPHEVTRNQLDNLYEAHPFRAKRQPIDLHLVERMSHWRSMAIQALSSLNSDDDSVIHRLINCLMLIRFLEDSGHFTEKMGDLVDGSKTALISFLRERFHRIREIASYPTPSLADLNKIEQLPLRTLISELYGYKEWGVTYDFSAISVDILGRFYEEYLQYQPLLKEVRPTLKQEELLLGQFSPAFEDVRKKKGIFYTPDYIVHYISNSLLRKHEAVHPKKCPSIVDLACGSGPFLVAAIGEMLQRPSWRMDAIQSVIGLDADPRAIEGARLNLVAKCLVEKITPPLPALRLIESDLVESGAHPSKLLAIVGEPNGVDIVVGNPPYVKYESLIKEYSPDLLKEGFEFGAQRVDSYILFIEASLRILKPGGYCGLVLPQAFLQSSSAGKLREWIADEAEILEVVDFQDQPVFQNVAVYVCLVLLRKKGGSSFPTQVTIAKIFELSETPGAQLAGLGMASGYEGDHEVFRVNQPSTRSAWVFRNERESSLFAKISALSTILKDSSIAVAQGIKTGADHIFVIDEKFAIESEITIPLLKGKDLRRWLSHVNSKLIYPYDRITGKPLSWNSIRKNYPKCATYLDMHKVELGKRRSLKNEAWHELIRPRTGTVLHSLSQLFISELSLRPSVSRSGATGLCAVLGSTGGGSWIILDESEYEQLSLLAFLNSSVSEWFFRQIAPVRRGGWMLIEQKTINELPVPNFLKDSNSFARSELTRVCEKLLLISGDREKYRNQSAWRSISALEEQIDSIIMEALEFTPSNAAYIRSRVSQRSDW